MAKKATGAKKMETTATPKRTRSGIAVRLELPEEDHERMAKLARRLGLSLASYARMAVMKQMEQEESAGK